MSAAAWLASLGPLSIVIMLVVIGLISRRFGQVTGAAPYYLACFLGALLVGASLLARLLGLVAGDSVAPTPLLDALPPLGLTVALWAVWRYWSWLLADRD